jgi:5-dehydro-2-deoxygluconokinase
MSFDLITMGRIGVDIYPLQTNTRLPDVETFGKFLGGSAANVAVAASRHGLRAALVSRTGEDPFGEYLRRALGDFGVDDRWVTPVAGPPTPVTFCEIFPPDDFPIYFYRYPTAPDLQIRTEELDLDEIRAARVFWVTGTGLCQEPSRSAHLAALRARGRAAGTGWDAKAGGGFIGWDAKAGGGFIGWDAKAGGGFIGWDAKAGGGITVFDLDYRPAFWSSREEAREIYKQALPYATVAVGNLDECLTAVGESEPYAAADALLAAGVTLAVVKQGPKGVLAKTPDETVEVPPVEVQVVNGIGAGDGFGGALVHGLLAGWPLARVLRFANAAGAIVASRLECSSAMPTTSEVLELVFRG